MRQTEKAPSNLWAPIKVYSASHKFVEPTLPRKRVCALNSDPACKLRLFLCAVDLCCCLLDSPLPLDFFLPFRIFSLASKSLLFPCLCRSPLLQSTMFFQPPLSVDPLPFLKLLAFAFVLLLLQHLPQPAFSGNLAYFTFDLCLPPSFVFPFHALKLCFLPL